MTKTLEDRLRDAKADLGKVNAGLVRHAGKVPTDVGNQFQMIIAFAGDINIR